jgi:holo-[acyl-carrier protein] synthase
VIAPLDGATTGSSRSIFSETGLRCGVDLVDLAQFRRDLEIGGNGFLRRIYTEAEVVRSGGRTELLAAGFAAKEAAAKALGSGIRGIGWKDIEVDLGSNDRPHIVLHGRVRQRATALGIDKWSLSTSHSATVALAVVIAELDEAGYGPTG